MNLTNIHMYTTSSAEAFKFLSTSIGLPTTICTGRRGGIGLQKTHRKFSVGLITKIIANIVYFWACLIIYYKIITQIVPKWAMQVTLSHYKTKFSGSYVVSTTCTVESAKWKVFQSILVYITIHICSCNEN